MLRDTLVVAVAAADATVVVAVVAQRSRTAQSWYHSGSVVPNRFDLATSNS